MSEIVRVAHAHGANRLIAFSVLGNERLLKRMGVNVHRAAPPQMIEGKPTLPFWIEIDEQTRAALNLDGLERVGGVPPKTLRRPDASRALEQSV